MVRLIAPSKAENLLLKAKLRDDAYAKWLNSDAGQEMQGRVARWFESNMRGCISNQGARYSYGEMLDVPGIWKRNCGMMPMPSGSQASPGRRWKVA